MMWLKGHYLERGSNSIKDVKSRLLTTFSVIALSSSFLVFLIFSLYLVYNEDVQIQQHLKSFKQVAIEYYSLNKTDSAQISPNIMAFYTAESLPTALKSELPYDVNVVTRFRAFSEGGFMVYHTNFVDDSGEERALYLSVGSRDLDFGDDNWDTLLLTAMTLMLLLIAFLRFSLQRMFDGVMSPISNLSSQLANQTAHSFSVPHWAIDEVKLLSERLNDYNQMKDRLMKQERMFANYASHELKTPIAIVLGAANLQGMKDDQDFQLKQRNRIINAATGMQDTVEVLLNIVKQENAHDTSSSYPYSAGNILLDKSISKLAQGVTFTLDIADSTRLNLPYTVTNILLKNLVENAIRFTQSGHVRVSIAPDLIEVCDSGIGLHELSEQDTEHGLGLLIVRRLCDSYGWSFSLENREQGGCVAQLVRSNPETTNPTV
ncbi:sensor histidine kinase [Vibrio tapetis]|uniref:histidine kinase n=1 Tax=Vibrio tapetis subsp. tapetis TaxID=1671868 RepID=A0A2N8ZL05_9VIBR|nr:HAMP domain-containing sensor histidine kinase [Vibrio tapetis]SON52567.1 putative two-component sensor [Vibrio tapetis subsp. tapetis]